MLRKILWLALTSGLAAKLYRDVMAARAVSPTPLEKEELHTWEDEGGALHPQSH